MLRPKRKTQEKFKVDIVNGELIGKNESRSGTTLDFFVDEGYFAFILTNNSDDDVEYDFYYLDGGEQSILPEGMVGFLNKGETEIIEGPVEGRFEWKTLSSVHINDRKIPSQLRINFYERAEKLDLVARPVVVSGSHEGQEIGEEEEFHRGLRNPFIVNINGI